MRHAGNITLGRCLLLQAVLLTSASVSAATIDGIDEINGAGLGDVLGLLLFSNAPNNDNAVSAAAYNALGFDEIIFDRSAPIDIVLNVSDSGGTSEYSVTSSLFNFSPLTWSGYEIELGFGSGDNFQAVGTGTGLDFDLPDIDDVPESILFPSTTVAENRLVFTGGEAPFGWVDAVFFDIDVPDGITLFTLRYTPILAASNVSIDIDPRSSMNEITGPNGWIYVAVLSTSIANGDGSDFDASTVRPGSVTFGPGNAQLAERPRTMDVDGDGDMDLVMRFPTRDSGIVCGDTEATLSGITATGNTFNGVDAIRTVGCQ